jgi:Sulfotransferase domain
VRATVPAERLLVFEVRDGWGPLCRFLDRPVPPGPFPHLNERELLRQVPAALASGELAARLGQGALRPPGSEGGAGA